MSYTKGKLVWYKNNDSNNQVTINYIENWSTTENNQPSNNMCSVRLPLIKEFFENGEFIPKEDDVMIVYYKVVTNNNDTSFSNNDIVWTGKFVDHQTTITPDNKTLNLKILDWGYDTFNRYDPSTYVNKGMKTDEIMVDIIHRVSEKLDGSGIYNLTTTNVETTRTDGSAFPVIEPTFGYKPFYEWVNELSSTLYTNSESELSSTLVHTRPMIFKIKGSDAYWYYPSSTSSITLDKDVFFDSIVEQTNNEKSTNRLILDCGEDFNGRPIHAYIKDESNTSSVVKERAEAKKALGGGNSDYDNSYHNLRAEYTLATNIDFRNKVREIAKSYAEQWFKLFGRGKRTIQLTLPTLEYNYGDIVSINIDYLKPMLYKVIAVTKSGNSNAFSSQIKMEEYIL